MKTCFLKRHLSQAFTLVEMLVALTVLVVLLGIIAAVTQGTSVAIHQAFGKLSTYAAARAAFDTVNAKLAQATLDTYLDYYDASGNLRTAANVSTFVPASYGRVSGLQFLVRQNSASGCGQEVYFQCPDAFSDNPYYQSTQGFLNACGYYVQYCSDQSFRPTLITTTTKWRYRLMQGIEPTELLQVYAANSASADNSAKWTPNIANTGTGNTPAADASPLADNIIALLVWPRLPVGQDSSGTMLAPAYVYDSQSTVAPTGSPPSQPLWANQLPPILQVTMVVIDEASAARLDTKSSTPPTQIQNALQGKFTDVTQYAKDLGNLANSLVANHIGYEVLNASVVLRESKWSQ